MKQEPAQILKVDVIGRVWTPRERREAVLDEFERSGMPAVKFAEHSGVKHPTLAAWVQRRRRRRAEAKAAGTAKAPGAAKAAGTAVAEGQGAAGFQWVEAMAGGGERGLMVHLPGGARVEVADRAQAALAAELLRALGADAREAQC